MEKARAYWDLACKQIDVHKHRHTQLFAVFLSGAIASSASVLLERVSPLPGLLLLLTMVAGATYAQAQLALVPLRLAEAGETHQAALDRLIYPGGD